jgi:WD40 repeat protein
MLASNPEALKLVKDYGRPSITFAIARLPKSDRVFLGSSDFQVCEGDLTASKFEPKTLYKHESYVNSLTLAGKTLVSGGYDGKLIWWDTQANKEIRKVDAHSKWIRRVISSPDGQFVCSIADDMLGKVWEASTGKLVRTLQGHELETPNNFGSMLYAVAYSADGKRIATGDKVGKVFVWDSQTGKQLAVLEAPVMYTWDPTQRRHSIGGIRSLAFSPDGAFLAVGGTGKIGNIDHLEAKGRVEIFDWAGGKRVSELTASKSQGLVNKLQFAPDGSWLLGCGGAGEGFFLFIESTGKKILKEEKLNSHAHDFTLSEDSSTIYTVTHSRVMIHKM